uniref:AlNc14C421G11525 protein n=1 Tax=Albugo laibachii Nc14 TaxID=890382 RepID=F0WZC2_9STRA|nr:AlNc14C421G11525 [Albugo laibachii Nc14]|eukprot:CCA26840.1 AlNc14C421G11525 [Albugo laibachii Nc14]
MEAEEDRCFPLLRKKMKDDSSRVNKVLMEKLNKARKNGCPEEMLGQMKDLLLAKQDCFRLELGQEPPVDVSPLKVRLKENAVPVRCKARKYTKENRVFMEEHVQQPLEADGVQ